MSSRLAWSTKQVPEQPGIYRETLSQKRRRGKGKRQGVGEEERRKGNFIFYFYTVFNLFLSVILYGNVIV